MSAPPARPTWTSVLRSDFPSSIVVFLVALPLCMGVAIASGAPVSAGLITGIVGGIVAGSLAGSPLQVSGPAAGLTVLILQFVQHYGLERLGVVVFAAGVIQLVAGSLRLGQWFRAVSPAVVQGMLAGIGVLILASQFHVMVDDKPKRDGLENLATIPAAVQKAFPAEGFSTGSSDQRKTRLALLKALGALHEEQGKLGEKVHFVVAAVTVADERAAAEHHPPDAVPREATISRELQQLADEQRQLLARLDLLAGEETRPAWEQARAAAQSALSDLEGGRVHDARASQDAAEASFAELRDSYKSHPWAATVGVLTIVCVVIWTVFIPKKLKFLPGPLLAIVIATTVAALGQLPVLYVEVPSRIWEEIFFPTTATLKTLLDPAMMLAAFEIAIIASAETLLCATAVDQLHSGKRTKYDQELMAQGVGNAICGLLGALPMTGVIVRSSANVQAGAQTRLSAILHGVWLLVFVVGLSFLLRLIPTSALAAILVYTGWKLIDFGAIRKLWQYSWVEVVIYAATLGTIVATDLLTGVVTGIVLSILKLVYTFSRLRITVTEEDGQPTRMHLAGAATFLRLPYLAETLESLPPQTELHVHFDQLDYIDHACLDLLVNWQKQHAAQGGRLFLDWDSLTQRFQPNASSPSESDIAGNGTVRIKEAVGQN